MARSVVGGLAAAVLALLAIAHPEAARADTEVDLQLVIAVDVSYSMDAEEQALQRQGFVDAFRSAAVSDAIRRGAVGRIAVTYVEWAGAADQKVLVPWMVVDGPESGAAFADEIAKRPTRRASRTSIAGAIDFSVRLMGEGGFAAGRRVIDVSGDGPNNQGRPVTAARADALAAGITVNGLPIMLKAPGYFDIADLDLYYRDCVIGGQGAFMVPARERDQFVEAIKTKIIMEVAERPVSDPRTRFGAAALVVPAQATPGRTNCMIGESQWRDRMGN